MLALLMLATLPWLALAVAAARAIRTARDLPTELPAAAPRVTAIVPGRDDGAALAAALESLRAQRGVELQVIAVDDRSTDDTPARLAALAGEWPALEPLRIDELPPGWLGKCHALHRASERAAGDWLLLVDADTRLGADVVARAVAAAERAGADHLGLLPGLRGTTAGGRAVMAGMSLAMLVRIALCNRDRSHLGIGGFQLVRTSAYRAAGGHEALRLAVVEDFELGRRLRQGGFRTRVLLALRDVSVEWVTDALSVIRLTEKNYFAAMGFRASLVAAVAGAGTAAWLLAAAGPWLHPLGWIPLGALASTALPAAAVARRYGWPAWTALGAPLAFPLVPAAMVWSAAATLWRGGVAWRGTFHSLRELRAAR